MEGIILYTTGCARCKVLEKKLDNAGVKYDINDDVAEMQALGLLSAPALRVSGELLDFAAACRWADSQKE